jgi:hypothetical protein
MSGITLYSLFDFLRFFLLSCTSHHLSAHYSLLPYRFISVVSRLKSKDLELKLLISHGLLEIENNVHPPSSTQKVAVWFNFNLYLFQIRIKMWVY